MTAGKSGGPRVPLVDPGTTDARLTAVFDAIRARGSEPLHIHRTVAQAPELLSAFLSYAFALRSSSVSPRADRELIILRTCQLTHGDYEIALHRGMGLAHGLTQAQVNELASWRHSSAYNERQRAILAFADGMFSDAGVDDAVFEELGRFFPPREVVELTLTAAFYGGLARFSHALGIPLDPDAANNQYERS